MAKIKLTTLTDKVSDDEILTKLKNIGVKVKEKDLAEVNREAKDEKTAPSGETVVEKRVASTIIRRRVQPPAPPPKEAPKEIKKAAEKEAKPAKKAEEKREKTKATPEKPVLTLQETSEAEVAAIKEVSQPQVQKTEIDQEIPGEEAREERLKGDVELIADEKKKEITKVLEEAYKHELEKDVTLGDKEEEEERKKKKTEKLLKKLEEQEIEEQKLKKKSPLKRKVIIKEEDLYAFRRQKGRPGQFRKDKRDRGAEKRQEEEKHVEAKPVKKTLKMGDHIQVDTLAKRLRK